jgi:AAA+ superfamily predicted ATPase
MKFEININSLSEDEQLFLANFEMAFNTYVASLLADYPNLGVTPVWTVSVRSDKFWKSQSNASFEIKDSLTVEGKIKGYLENKLFMDIKVFSLFLNLKYRSIAPKSDCRGGNNTAVDGLPNFIPQEPLYSFEQIILPEETKNRILSDLNSIKCQDLIYNQWGFSKVEPKPKSILNFFGPPGTGKTMCAHAIAKELGKPLLALNYSEIESKYVGDAAKNLKKAFDTATEINAVMFFDEADSFLGKRIENVSHGSDQALNSLRSQMLILLEEFEGIVLFATNLVTNFDKAFESRILDHIKLELPNREARAAIISKMLPEKMPLEHRFTDDELLEASDLIDGFAGREIKNAILTMLLDKASMGLADPVFTLDDLKEALVKKKDQLEKLKAEENNRRKDKIIKRLQDRIEEDAAYERQKNNYNKRRKKKNIH